MQGSIPAPSSGLLWKNKKNAGSQIGHNKKIFNKVRHCPGEVDQDRVKVRARCFFRSEVLNQGTLNKGSVG
jgi:hypothetical protein